MRNLESEIIHSDAPEHEVQLRSKEDLERIAERKHFNERMEDNKDRLKHDMEEEHHIEKAVHTFSKQDTQSAQSSVDTTVHLEAKAKRVKRIATNIVDFVPIVGSIKMIVEGWKGKQFGTDKEIHGIPRMLHTGTGIVFLVLDATGIGAIVSELGKGVIKLGERTIVRSVEDRLAKEAIKKEGEKLAVRGEERIDRKEEIRNRM